MNTELIKKYKKEFDHFLNGGELLTRTKSDFIWNDEINENLMWNFEIKDIDIIINDEFSELRKALCDGKIIQIWEVIKQHVSDSYKDIYGWKDFKSFKPNSPFDGEIHNYRIKPEEPKFKAGDFVRDIISGKVSQVNNEDIANGKYSQVTKWEPYPRELCWFWSGNKLEEAKLSKFHSYTKHGGFKTIYDSFKYCEPFLNSKPSWFKD